MLLPSKATPLTAPTLYVPIVAPVAADSRETVPEPEFATQMHAPSKATPSALVTGTTACEPVDGYHRSSATCAGLADWAKVAEATTDKAAASAARWMTFIGNSLKLEWRRRRSPTSAVPSF